MEKGNLSSGWRITIAAAIAVMATAFILAPVAALSITSAAISFPSVTLNGADQTVTGSTSAWRADSTGEAGGWNLTVSSGDFGNGGGKTIAVANFEIRLLDSNISLVSGDANVPTSTQTSYTALSGSATKIASAAVGEGDGVYDLTPDFRLTVPAETYTGSYSATVTIAISTGP